MNKERRYDIDWIRVIVFDLLILYHVGMFFVDWDYHIKNNDIVDWLLYPMAFLSQWRLPLLFLVSGIGTRFALSYKSGPEYVKERVKRLFIPLLLGVLIIVPPQVYLERISNGDFVGSFFSYYPNTFSGIYPEGNFSWHHLWFLPYLLLMSIVSAPIFLKLRKPGNRFVEYLKRMVEKFPYTLFLLVVPLFFIEGLLEPIFPVTRALIGDWYALVMYWLFFFSGYLLICIGDSIWKALDRIKLPCLIIGILVFPILFWFWVNVKTSVFIPLLDSLNIWAWIFAILGYGAKYLNRPSSLLEYRNRAVYPIYILHQTITLIIGYYVMNIHVHYLWKMIFMVVCTFGISMLIYELLIKRVKFLWPLFGLKKETYKKVKN